MLEAVMLRQKIRELTQEIERRILVETALHESARRARLEDKQQTREFALERAQLRARAEQATERTVRFQEVTAALSEARTPADVTRVMVTQSCVAFRAPRGLIALLTEDGAMLDVAQTLGYPADVASAPGRVPMRDDRPLTEVARTGEPLFFTTAEAVVSRYPHLAGERRPQGMALAVLPLAVQGRILGVMRLSFDESRLFDEDDQIFLIVLARLCAQALDRARLYEAEARARAEAEAANRAKDEFLTTLSHELRTPLTSVLGWANILLTRTLEPSAVRRALRSIERNAKAQAQLVEDILDVSRIVTGKLRLELRVMDPVVVVRAAVDAARPSAEEKHIVIEAQIEDGIGTLAADPERLQQIVSNLLSNALKFTPKGGSIGVRLDRKGGRLRLSVTDSGEGIAPEFLPQVFERFRQASAGNARAHGGLGVGLAIVEHLVALHAGTVEASSAGLGQGATFTVTLPIVSPAEERAGWVEDRVTPAPLSLEGVRVVIVDDHADTLELIETVLRAQGASVTSAASAAEALRAVETTRPDVLVCDIGLPDEDGYALLEKVRARMYVPALAVTGHATPGDASAATAAGFQGHLAKPVAPAVLIDAVARLAKRVKAS